MFQFTPSTNLPVLPQSFRLHQPITDITRIIVSPYLTMTPSKTTSQARWENFILFHFLRAMENKINRNLKTLTVLRGSLGEKSTFIQVDTNEGFSSVFDFNIKFNAVFINVLQFSRLNRGQTLFTSGSFLVWFYKTSIRTFLAIDWMN